MNELQNLINAHYQRLDNLSRELKQQKEMLNDLLEKDEEFVQAEEEAKKTAKVKALAKKKILLRPEARALVEKIKDNQFQIKEIKLALSDYLAQYMREAGTTQIAAPDGSSYRIVYTARLVKSE
ncbi:MAG TPA: hypothetical protein P5562_03485 [Candidatus Woesebacteria bacterium]|nr:hypothetical protein [Candidatus Woesebacteria bacterium]